MKITKYSRLRQPDWKVGKAVVVAGTLYMPTDSGWKKLQTSATGGTDPKPFVIK